MKENSFFQIVLNPNEPKKKTFAVDVSVILTANIRTEEIVDFSSDTSHKSY